MPVLSSCESTAHRFAKFDDATIFCQRCGEQRVMDVQALIAKLPAPMYLPCPGPHYPTWTPAPWYPWIVTSSVTSFDGSSTTDVKGLVLT